MSLFQAEVRRFFARRFTLVMLLILVGVFAVVAVSLAINSHHPTDAELAQAKIAVTQQIEQRQQEIAECQRQQLDPPAEPIYPIGVDCDQYLGGYQPTVENYLPYQLTLTNDMNDALFYYAGLIALFGFAVGASFIGAEWSSGGLANLLLWRPRRAATMGAKLGAMLAGQFAVSVVLLIGWVATMCAIAATRGQFGHMTSGIIQSQLLTAARGIGLGLFAAGVGFAVASLGRRTAAALGFGIGYLIVVEAGGRLLLASLRVDRPDRFALSNYIGAWLTKRREYGPSCDPQTGTCGSEWFITMGNAAELLTVITVLLLGVAFVTFSRRDVA
jgi:type II secretory pathway pseudopilin PulG